MLKHREGNESRYEKGILNPLKGDKELACNGVVLATKPRHTHTHKGQKNERWYHQSQKWSEF